MCSGARRASDGWPLRRSKAIGLLDARTDPAALAAKAWIDLPGVDDAWIKGLTIESVAGGGPPPELTPEALAALFAREPGFRLFCGSCSDPMMDPSLCGIR